MTDFWGQFLCFVPHVSEKKDSGTENTNMTDDNANIDDIAAVLTITAPFADE